MSQQYVEIVLGRLVTDEAFRRRFEAAPSATLEELLRTGARLTPVERDALMSVHPSACERFADALDRRLQKARLR